MNSEALELLGAGALFEVLDHDHPDFPFYVSFDDEVAHEYDDAIDRLVEEVIGLTLVVRAVREDREVVLVGGTIGRPALEVWLTDWWHAELGQESSPEQDDARPAASKGPRRSWFRRR